MGRSHNQISFVFFLNGCFLVMNCKYWAQVLICYHVLCSFCQVSRKLNICLQNLVDQVKDDRTRTDLYFHTLLFWLFLCPVTDDFDYCTFLDNLTHPRILPLPCLPLVPVSAAALVHKTSSYTEKALSYNKEKLNRQRRKFRKVCIGSLLLCGLVYGICGKDGYALCLGHSCYPSYGLMSIFMNANQLGMLTNR